MSTTKKIVVVLTFTGILAILIFLPLYALGYGIKVGSRLQHEEDDHYLERCFRDNVQLTDQCKEAGLVRTNVCDRVCEMIEEATGDGVKLSRSFQEPAGGCACFFKPDM